MNVSFVLHLYQPSFQSREVVDRIAKECYYPLLKLIQSKKDIVLTLNVSLSLLELMDKYGHGDWIKELKELYKNNRVELTGSAAYHSILPLVPEFIAEDEIVLNEYGMGYYLGSKQDFEGHQALMLRDVRGFFPPELAVDEKLVEIVSGLGYDWMLVSEMAIQGINHEGDGSPECVYELPDLSCKIVCRDSGFSNLLSFKRDLDISDINNYLTQYKKDNLIVALDGEFFGHHYKDGLRLFDILIDKFKSESSSIISMTEIVSKHNTCDINTIHESTWSTTVISGDVSDIYPLWDDQKNPIHVSLHTIMSLLVQCITEGSIVYDKGDRVPNDMSSLPSNELGTIYMNIHKIMCSDKYWWASKKYLPKGEYLYEPSIVEKCLEYLVPIIASIEDDTRANEITAEYEKIRNLLNNNHENN